MSGSAVVSQPVDVIKKEVARPSKNVSGAVLAVGEFDHPGKTALGCDLDLRGGNRQMGEGFAIVRELAGNSLGALSVSGSLAMGREQAICSGRVVSPHERGCLLDVPGGGGPTSEEGGLESLLGDAGRSRQPCALHRRGGP